MSNGSYDYEAEQEAKHKKYLLAIAIHLHVKTQDSSEKVLSLVKSTEIEKAEELLSKLLNGEYQAWAAYLLDCQKHNQVAFDRARDLAPWPVELKIQELVFGYSDDRKSFWKPFFNKFGYATGGCHGNTSGIDTYIILYNERLTIEQIVKGCIWLGFKISGYRGLPKTPLPESPWEKDRLEP